MSAVIASETRHTGKSNAAFLRSVRRQRLHLGAFTAMSPDRLKRPGIGGREYGTKLDSPGCSAPQATQRSRKMGRCERGSLIVVHIGMPQLAPAAQAPASPPLR